MSKNNLKEFWVMKEPVGVIYQQLIEFAQRFSSSILFEFLELGKTDLSKVPDFFKDLLHLEAIQFTSSNKSEYATQQTLARCKISAQNSRFRIIHGRSICKDTAWLFNQHHYI